MEDIIYYPSSNVYVPPIQIKKYHLGRVLVVVLSLNKFFGTYLIIPKLLQSPLETLELFGFRVDDITYYPSSNVYVAPIQIKIYHLGRILVVILSLNKFFGTFLIMSKLWWSSLETLELRDFQLDDILYHPSSSNVIQTYGPNPDQDIPSRKGSCSCFEL